MPDPEIPRSQPQYGFDENVSIGSFMLFREILGGSPPARLSAYELGRPLSALLHAERLCEGRK